MAMVISTCYYGWRIIPVSMLRCRHRGTIDEINIIVENEIHFRGNFQCPTSKELSSEMRMSGLVIQFIFVSLVLRLPTFDIKIVSKVWSSQEGQKYPSRSLIRKIPLSKEMEGGEERKAISEEEIF